MVQSPWFRSRIRIQSQIWVVPAGYVALALAAGWLLAQVDDGLLAAGRIPLFTIDAATAILTSVLSGMLAFTGFVFSMTFIMVQFGSSQYTPRLSGYLLRDRVVRHALGMFTATFVYALVALTVINRGGSAAAIDLAVISVLGAVLGSVVLFLALIQRVTVLQVTNVLHQVGALGRAVIEELYPSLAEAPKQEVLAAALPGGVLPPVTQEVHYHGGPMAIVAVHTQGLARLAQAAGGIIELEYAVGDTLSEGARVMRVRGAGRKISPRRLWDEITIGPQRTVEQDPKYAIRLIVDIAIRALSPAVNDPTTAVQALDELEDLLGRIATRQIDVGYTRDRAGAIRVVYPTPIWEDFLSLAVSEIRQYGAASLQVMRRMHALLDDLHAIAPPDRQAAIEFQLLQLVEAVPRAFVDPDDQFQALQVDRQGIGLSRHAEEGASHE